MTAEEILQKHYVHDRGLINQDYVIEAMQEYAHQAIEEAAKINYNHIIPGHSVQEPSMCNASESILKLKDKY